MNPDPMMRSVRVFEERAAEDLGTTLTLEPAESSCSSQSNPEKKITGHLVRQHLKEAVSTVLVENTAIIIRALGYSLSREIGCPRPPESGVPPLASASNPHATLVGVTT